MYFQYVCEGVCAFLCMPAVRRSFTSDWLCCQSSRTVIGLTGGDAWGFREGWVHINPLHSFAQWLHLCLPESCRPNQLLTMTQQPIRYEIDLNRIMLMFICFSNVLILYTMKVQKDNGQNDLLRIFISLCRTCSVSNAVFLNSELWNGAYAHFSVLNLNSKLCIGIYILKKVFHCFFWTWT